MPIVGPALSAAIQAQLAPWNGKQLTAFCQAIGNGIVLATAGKLQFETSDVGGVAGSGVGTGKGVLGLNPKNMSSVIYAKGQEFWAPDQRDGPGVEWQGFCDKVSLAIVTYLAAEADLLSQHSPVFAGAGVVTKYSGLTPDAVAGSIVGQAPAGWAKAKMPELALAVGTGYVTELESHSPASTVTIAGSPAGPPSGGSGSGKGVVL